MTFQTADLCDAFEGELQVAEPILRSFGVRPLFCGPITTIRCADDNSLVREAVAEPGEGRVLVVDNGGSLRCALLGDRLAALASDNDWAGVVIHGAIRDAAVVRNTDIACLALAACPRRSVKRGQGERDVPVGFAGVTFTPGHFLYADEDGLLVSARDLLQPAGD